MRILALLLSLLTANAGWADTATVVRSTRVNLRSGKTDTYRVIKALEPGTELQVLRLERAYVQVKTDDDEIGWLPLRLVSINKATAVPVTAGTSASAVALTEPSIQELREEIQRAQRELKQARTPLPDASWWMVGAAAAGGLGLGVLLGMAGLQAYYRKRLHGLRI